MKVRRLTPADADLGASLIAKLKLRGDAAAPTRSQMSAWLADPCHILLAAVADGDAPVGYAVAYLMERVDGTGPMLFFYEIEVAPSARRRGVGRLLVAEMRRIAEHVGAVKMWVETDRSNMPARALYSDGQGQESDELSVVYTWYADAA